MNWGIIGACIATIISGLSVTLQKKESMHYDDRFLALVYQFGFAALWWLLFVSVWMYTTKSAFFPSMWVMQWLLFATICIAWYVAMTLIFKAYKHMHGWVVLIIMSVNVFLMYFVNVWLFPGVEALSPLKIAIAVVFFLVLMQFIIHRSDKDIKHTHFINADTLYALWASLCSAYFVTGNNYLIKGGHIEPLQVVVLVEICTLIIGLLWYFTGDRWSWSGLKRNITRREAMVFATIGLCGATAGSLHYYAYDTNPANLINFVKLFSIITAAVLCRIFLNDKLSRRQILLMILALIVLVLFVVVT